MNSWTHRDPREAGVPQNGPLMAVVKTCFHMFPQFPPTSTCLICVFVRKDSPFQAGGRFKVTRDEVQLWSVYHQYCATSATISTKPFSSAALYTLAIFSSLRPGQLMSIDTEWLPRKARALWSTWSKAMPQISHACLASFVYVCFAMWCDV